MSSGVDSFVLQTLERGGITVFERGWLSSNIVLIRGLGDVGAAVVDTGYWAHANQTVALLHHALQGRPLAKTINTHLHSDHCGGNMAISAAFSCEIHIPAGDAGVVDAWDEAKLTFKATGQHCPRFQRTGSVRASEEIQLGSWRWHTVASPGHDANSIALYQPDLKILISADALWENGFGVVFPELEGLGAFDEVANTLDVFAELAVDVVIPGHGPPFTDFSGALRRARSRLQDFMADPARHAFHAAKVLVKFRLLETRDESVESFNEWLHGTPYFGIVRERYFQEVPDPAWRQSVVDDMASRGAIKIIGSRIKDSG